MYAFHDKGELLINSEEYPGNTLHEKQFILQAIGSKIEILALTDVEYITFWFNELPLLCEDRYNEIKDQAEAPLTYTPLVMSERIHSLISSMPDFLNEKSPCSKYIELKCKGIGIPDYQFLSATSIKDFLLPDQYLYGELPILRDTKLQQREERGRICTSGRLYDHYFPPTFQKPLWCARIRMDTGERNGKESSKTYSTPKCGLLKFATGYGFTPCRNLPTFVKTLLATPHAPYARKQPMALQKKSERLAIKELFL